MVVVLEMNLEEGKKWDNLQSFNNQVLSCQVDANLCAHKIVGAEK